MSAAVIRKYAQNLPSTPGVYRMIDGRGMVLYVGKARNLKRRVDSYTHDQRLSPKLQRMVAQTAEMAFLTTRSEIEALLLEAALIKRLQPRYNVLLRDDKSLPHIVLTASSPFPALYRHRGTKKHGEVYFGPFSSPAAVKDTLSALHRTFLLRMCSDSVFKSRSRPCLEYQIKRCSAPCVGYISQKDYHGYVQQAKEFFQGKSRQIRQEFTERMLAASERQDFEAAARYRDRLRSLTEIQAQQAIHVPNIGDTDVTVSVQKEDLICIHVVLFRNDHHCGELTYFPSCLTEMSLEDVMRAFLTQYYHGKQTPRHILLSHSPSEKSLLLQALRLKGKVTLRLPQRGKKREVIDYALNNARQALERRLVENAASSTLRRQLAEIFDLPHLPNRIEVFDNSHHQGAHAVSAVIVADTDGFDKRRYRRYSLKTPLNDDYALMGLALRRRFQETASPLPDLILIDGGVSQLTAALTALKELSLSFLPVIAIAKNPDQDKFFQQGQPPKTLDSHPQAAYFLQRLRDEAHRFAIGGYRKRHQKSLISSQLDQIPGIGAQRRQRLLLHFGSAKAVSRSGIKDLTAVEGINQRIARRIYEFFHTP